MVAPQTKALSMNANPHRLLYDMRMDKRLKKTDAAIYRAFGECLKQKSFADITVEDILRSANVSRSTFYTHFKTKNDVLDSLVQNIFHHVFSHSLQQEQTHDFSHDSVEDYEHLFTHIVYHLRDEKELIQTVLNASCREQFFAEFRLEVRSLIERSLRKGIIAPKDIPEALQVNAIIENYVVLLDYWFASDCADSPEQVTKNLFKLCQ